MASKFFLTLFVCCMLSTCHCSTRPRDLLPVLQKEAELPWLAAHAAGRLSVLEEYLPEVLAVDKTDFTAEWRQTIAVVIAAYQFYYFIAPDRTRSELLRQAYAWLDRHYVQSGDEGKTLPSLPAGFYELRKMLTWVELRNAAALHDVDALLDKWQSDPGSWKEVAKQMQVGWEVGGVVLKNTATGIDLQFVADAERQRLVVYLEELRQNRFDHLDFIAKIFMARFFLQQVGAGPATQLYTHVAGDMAQRAFTALHHLARTPRPYSDKVAKEIAHHKKNLQVLGLEAKLLRHTYHMDKEPYLAKPDTTFFFHSHPCETIPHYPLVPSRHDEEMSFRIGPCLVFVVEPHHISVYLIVNGQSKLYARLTI
jgi:hypothetical protein